MDETKKEETTYRILAHLKEIYPKPESLSKLTNLIREEPQADSSELMKLLIQLEFSGYIVRVPISSVERNEATHDNHYIPAVRFKITSLGIQQYFQMRNAKSVSIAPDNVTLRDTVSVIKQTEKVEVDIAKTYENIQVELKAEIKKYKK